MEANIKSLKENPRKYAVIEALKTLPENSRSSFTNIGSLNDLDLITHLLYLNIMKMYFLKIT